MPRATKEERETRDALVLRMFLAGIPYRDIGKNGLVKLSAQGVHNVIKKQMKDSAKRRDFLSDNAFDVHVERLESIFAANYSKAVSGDPKAGELCRRILDQLARVHGIIGSGSGEVPPPPRVEDTDDDEDSDDELGEYRKRTRGA